MLVCSAVHILETANKRNSGLRKQKNNSE